MGTIRPVVDRGRGSETVGGAPSAVEGAARRAGEPPAWRRRLAPALLVVLATALLLAKLRLSRVLNLNWDEFHFLSQVYVYGRGDLTDRFLTFHVHLFGWLKYVPGGEVDRLLAARASLWGLRIGSLTCIYLIGRRLVGRTGALFAACFSMMFSYVMRHGETFRFDPLISFLFLLAATLVVLRPYSRGCMIGAAVAVAVSAMISVKTVFFAPTMALLFAARIAGDADRGRMLRQLGLFSGALLASFAALYWLHDASLAQLHPRRHGFLASASSRMLVFDGNFPKMKAFIGTLRWDAAYWLVLLLGAGSAFGDALHLRGEPRIRALMLLAFSLPLFSLVIYRNSFPYYYVSVIPPASLLCGAIAGQVERKLSRFPIVAAIVIALLAARPALQSWRLFRLNDGDAVAAQRAVLAGVHEIFPEPVPYIDRCNMVAAYPKVGPFMSTAVMSEYLRRRAALMPSLLRREQPVFVLQNVESLDLGRTYAATRNRDDRLLPADFEAMQQNFVAHWGPVWVAGKRIRELDGRETSIDVVIGGRYTIEAARPLVVDGQSRQPGEVVTLQQGRHRLRSPQGEQTVTLRWGDHLAKPHLAIPPEPLFTGLDFRRR